MKFNLFNFIGTKSSIKIEDFLMSRYLPIYNYHSKRTFKEFLEQKTLTNVNELIKNTFPNKIKKSIKIELVDCVIIFLKYFSVKYDYYPGHTIYNTEFEKIIVYNFNKILTKIN